MDDQPSVLDQVRELHSPVFVSSRDGVGPKINVRECAGCPKDSEFRDRPVWPCSTALLVYSLTEIEEANC